MTLPLYQKKVINDIVPVSIDYTSGYNTALLNVGNLRYNGIELALGGTPVSARKFSWDVDFNGSYTEGKVLSLGDLSYITLGSATPDWGSIAYIQQIVGKTPLQIIALTPETDDNGKTVINPDHGAPDPASAVPKDFGAAISPWAAGMNNSFQV